MTEPRTPRSHLSQTLKVAAKVLGYLALLAIAVGFEARDQLDWSKTPCDAPTADVQPPFYAQVYSAIISWTSKETIHPVSVVSIPASLEEIQQDLCLGRAYMADLLQAVASQHPSVIVIDKYYSPASCSATPLSTNNLLAAVQSITMPVVIAESVDTAPGSGVNESCIVQKTQLDFHSAGVHHGLTRLNVNKEQIPLRWGVLPSAAADATPADRDSLALVATQLADPSLVAQPRFSSTLSGPRQPFGRLTHLPSQHTSSDLLCLAGSAAAKDRWHPACSPASPPLDLAGRVVVIGAENEVDHPIALGSRWWGFQLQASYIDALLTGSYLRTLTLFWSVVPLALYVILIEFGAELLKQRRLHSRSRLLQGLTIWHNTPYFVLTALLIIVVTVLLSLLLRYMPPLVAIAAIVFALFARLLVAGLAKLNPLEQDDPR